MDTIDLKSRYDRFADALWFPTEHPMVLVGGCGGIGSWLSMFLARAGFTPAIYDFDIIEEHNIGGQLLKPTDVGKTKVSSIGDTIKQFTGEEQFHLFEEKIDKDSMSHNYCFSAFDNMKARRTMFESWQKQFGHHINSIFIDGRLMAESYEILCVTGNDPIAQDRYEKEYLFSDDEVEDAPCSLKQTTHMAGIIAGQMTGFFTNFLTNIAEKEEVREVPFFHSYFLPMNLTNTITHD